MDALRRLEQVSHQAWGVYPTPIEPMDRLRAQLGEHAPRLFIKRDDYTGFALGGNKVRKLEYELAPERVQQADVLITAGGFGSNHCRVTAAAAARLGKRCILVLNGTPPDPPRGNAMLQQLFGAEIVVVPDRATRATRMQEIAAGLERAGQRALVVPLGASTGIGALGYVRAAAEFAAQRAATGLPATLTIVVSASSAGTLAGLWLGVRLAGESGVTLAGISPDDPADQILARAREIALQSAALLDAPATLDDQHVTMSDAYVGDGYGIPTTASKEAIDLFARFEGIVLDPVYTAKAAAGLIDRIRRGESAATDTVVFWHTGGHPALF